MCALILMQNIHDLHMQDFIESKTLELFEFRTDLNMPKENIWQTKLKVKVTDPQRFLLHEDDCHNPELADKLQLLEQEMTAVFNMIH